MISSARAVFGRRLLASDGDAGRVEDLLFDDANWRIQFVVIHLRYALRPRRVLISSRAVSATDSAIRTGLTREEVQRSASAKVRRVLRTDVWSNYWQSEGTDPVAPYHEDEELTCDLPHCRSSREIIGYSIQASDGKIGCVEDLLFAADDSTVRYVLVDTVRWWPSPAVMVPVSLLGPVRREDRRIDASVGVQKIRRAPAFQRGTGEEESRIHFYFGLKPYWEADKRRSRHL